jgi:hypothetical protein
MSDGVGQTMVTEALSQTLREPDRAVGGYEQSCTPIRGDRAAIESPHKFAAPGGSKFHLRLATLRRLRGASSSQRKSFSQNKFV